MVDAFLAASINSNSHTKLSSDAGPFILNSGATIHISPDASNFLELRAIPPWTIKGIGGSSINATGLRKIHLHLAKGHTIILDPTLYMSIIVLREGPQQLISYFNGNVCWLTNHARATITSRELSKIGRCLYTINMDSPLIEHTFIATRVPDLETWHCCLGHVNYQLIVEMSDRNIAKGMHINLSSALPKCQSCILGKQMKLSVPKICEGKRAGGALEIVYIDLTRPESVQLASGNSYVMNLIDDATSFCWAISLHLKLDVIKELKDRSLLVERKTSKTISHFNIDNGELKSIEFVPPRASNPNGPPHLLQHRMGM
jgi:hypothetical protein